MAVTLKDIAKKAGLSVSTVSRVLNEKASKARISPETASLVIKTAMELRYRPNQLARGLRLKRTQTIGLIAPDLANPFFAAIIKSAENLARSMGYSLIVCDTDEDLEMEVEHLSLLRSKGVDGLIVLPVGQKASHIQALSHQRFPVVLVDRSLEGCNVNVVVIDNHLGAFEAVEHLILRGHRQIAIIQGLPGTFTAAERRRGYVDAFAKHGVPLDEGLMVGNDFRKKNGYIETKFLLGRKDRPTAIFTTSDLITLGALQAILEEGLNIPQDISVVAFDDFESAELLRCPITAVAQPKEHMGEIAVKLLTDQIKNPNGLEPRQIVLKPSLVVRGSVARLTQLVPTNRPTKGALTFSR